MQVLDRDLLDREDSVVVLLPSPRRRSSVSWEVRGQ